MKKLLLSFLLVLSMGIYTHADTSVYGLPISNVNIDNSIIGATTAAAGTFTTLIGTTIDGIIGSVTPAAITATNLKADNKYGDNLLINGSMRVAQRATSFVAAANNDDVYTLDRWNLLSDGNDIVDVTQATESPTGALNSIGLDVETASKKFGILQVIEQKNAARVIGGTVSLSFQAKVTSAAAGRLDNIKAVVLSWSSTADTVTSDVVSAWGAEDTTPTFATNWTAENTPANLGVTTSWATYKIEGISIDTASTKNIAVFIWADGLSGTVTDFLYVTDALLEEGAVATNHAARDYADELTIAQRYYERVPWGSQTVIASGYATSTTVANFAYTYKVEKRVNPTMGFSDVEDFKINKLATTIDTTGITAALTNKHSTRLAVTVAAVLVAGQGMILLYDATATGYIEANSEL